MAYLFNMQAHDVHRLFYFELTFNFNHEFALSYFCFTRTYNEKKQEQKSYRKNVVVSF